MGFKKGNTLGRANKGRKPAPQTIEASVSARIGKELSKKHKDKIRDSLRGRAITWGEKLSKAQKGIAKPNLKGEKHGKWKGDFAGYGAMHSWVRRWKGKPNGCECCGTKIAKRFEWANIDHNYKRVLEDYISMCPTCHKRYDRDMQTK